MARAFKNLPAFNKAMKADGFDLELVKGDGYFWYYSPDLNIPEIPSVYVCHFNQMTPEQWGQEFDNAQMFARQGRAEHENKQEAGPLKISTRPRIC